MRSRILLIGGNYYPELTGIGKYNGEMMDWLAAQGNDCTVITTYPYYPDWKVQSSYRQYAFRYKKEIIGSSDHFSGIRVYRCPQYVPSTPSGSRRMLQDLSFFLSALILLLYLLFKKRYTHIITVVPSFQVGLLALLYKSVRGTKFIYHIQDLQIDAARDLNMIRSGMLLKILFRLEKFILQRADIISSISPGMNERISRKCGRPVIYFPNWVDTSEFYPIHSKEELKSAYGFDSKDKVVLYSGAIGEKQGLEEIIRAAKNLMHFPRYKFIICGSGPYREKLMQMANEAGVDNVQFHSLKPLGQLNRFLNMADIHLVIQKSNASDLVMPSKLTTILAIGGIAIITAPPSSSLYKIVSAHNMGVLIEPENHLGLASAILSITSYEEQVISSSARRYAEEFLTRDNVLSGFFQHINIGSTRITLKQPYISVN